MESLLKNARVLVVDDDADVLTAARLLLKRHVKAVTVVDNPEQIPARLADGDTDIVLLDMNFAIGSNTGREGLEWLERVQQLDSGVIVILMTAYGDAETAVAAMKKGAADFVLKPWQNEKLLATLNAAARLHKSRNEVRRLKSRQRELTAQDSPQLIATSAGMKSVLALVNKTASTDANILIQGENGTGKELIARAIHDASDRADEVMLSIDLGSLAESTFESELFGHVKGAFTDARSDRDGRFRAAAGGTLFLDEIGNLPLHLQAKLLRVLEQREVTPVGSDQAVPIDVRLVSATNVDLESLVADGNFRPDLLYRINTVKLELPPLRERVDDIRPLAEHFLEQNIRKYRLNEKRLPAATLQQLEAYGWPGNVRELAHAMERAVIISDSAELLPEDLMLSGKAGASESGGLGLTSFNLEEVERQVVEAALKHHGGNVSHTAKALGITRTSLYRRMEKYAL